MGIMSFYGLVSRVYLEMERKRKIRTPIPSAILLLWVLSSLLHRHCTMLIVGRGC